MSLAREDVMRAIASARQWSRDHPFLTACLVDVVVTSLYSRYKRRIPQKTVLELDLTRYDDVVDRDRPRSSLQASMESSVLHFQELLHVLRDAADDSRVVGMFMRLPGSSGLDLGLARINELCEALRYFREGGKLVVAWGQHFTVDAPAGANYLLSSACSRIYVPRMAIVSVTGPTMQVPFLRGLLDMVGVLPQIYQREEYKGMANIFNEHTWTEAHRENYERLLETVTAALVEVYAQNRGVPSDRARQWLAGGPYGGEQALEVGVVDGIAELDEMFSRVLPALFGELGAEADTEHEPADAKPAKAFEARLLALQIYAARVRAARGSSWSARRVLAKSVLPKGYSPVYQTQNWLLRMWHARARTHTIAIVTLEGTIEDGRAPPSWFGPEAEDRIFGDTAAAAVREARLDTDVSVILVRINSGGGSATASEQIARELQLAQRAGKKVVISMADVAASGGYWISARADSIVCDRFTLTGSIGVVFGKMVTREFWTERVKVNYETLTNEDEMPSSTFWSTQHMFNDAQEAQLNTWLDDVYSGFLQLVSAGRGLTLEQTRERAKGRVYLADEARELDLVDSSRGGLFGAIGECARLLNVEHHDSLVLKRFPRKLSLFEALARGTGRNSRQSSRGSFAYSLLRDAPLTLLRAAGMVMRAVSLLGNTTNVAVRATARVRAAGSGHLQLLASPAASPFAPAR